MDNRNNESKFTKIRNKAGRAFEKDGFYFILFICICVVATTATWISKQNVDKINKLNESYNLDEIEEPEVNQDLIFSSEDENESSDVEIVEVGENIEDVSDASTEEKDLKETEEEIIQYTKDKNISETEDKDIDVALASDISSQKTQDQILRSMIVPLAGSMGMDYAKEKLVYSKTLEQWTTHNGIDIRAGEGSVVRAALDGVVTEISKDKAHGITITLTHGNGVITKYGFVSTDEMIEVGQEVKKGDPISGVGEAQGFELAQGPHLHFEVLKDGEHIDPKLYLPKLSTDE